MNACMTLKKPNQDNFKEFPFLILYSMIGDSTKASTMPMNRRSVPSLTPRALSQYDGMGEPGHSKSSPSTLCYIDAHWSRCPVLIRSYVIYYVGNWGLHLHVYLNTLYISILLFLLFHSCKLFHPICLDTIVLCSSVVESGENKTEANVSQ